MTYALFFKLKIFAFWGLTFLGFCATGAANENDSHLEFGRKKTRVRGFIGFLAFGHFLLKAFFGIPESRGEATA